MPTAICVSTTSVSYTHLAELQRIEETKRHKEQQVSLAEQELKQVKAEIRTDKLKSAATDVATAITLSLIHIWLPVIAHYNYTLRFRSCGLSRGD